MMDIWEVNLSIANVCNADCIYCPRSYVIQKNKFMPIELVEHIASNITDEKFKAENKVVQSVLSENGEPFLHPNALDCLRIMRKTGLHMLMFSNFSVLNENLAHDIIKEHLFDAIHMNIDGATPETYKAAKKLDLNKVEKNLRTFIQIRNEMKSTIRVFTHVITPYFYTEAVRRVYGRDPVKGNENVCINDEKETIEKIKGIINPELDNVGADSVAFWAERYTGKAREGNFCCPNLTRVKHVAYINPDGNWYACCLDMGNDLIMGNVYEHTLQDIAKSEKRRILVKNLESRNFEEVGFPCTRVDACHGLGHGMIE